MTKVDLIIENGTVCTMNKLRETMAASSVVVNSGKILAIDTTENIRKIYSAETTVNAENCIVMPGLINTHTHSPLTFLRGISDDLELMDWLKKYIWPIEGTFITEDFVSLSSKLAICEMVLGGTTTFNDAYFYSKEVARAAKSMGVRCIAGELLFDHSSPIKKTPEETLAYIQESFEEWKGDELIRVSIAPHSLYACSQELIQRASKIAQENNSLMHIHVSESQNEVSGILAKHGRTPVEVLNDLGVLNSSMLAAHCVVLTETDMDLLAQKQVGISHNPESNMKLGNGVAPIAALLKKGAKIGIGTDGAASNNDLSLLAEVGFAAKLQKGYFKDSTLMTSMEAVEMLTINGAKSLNLDDQIGSLEIGKKADIILIDLIKPHLTPIYSPYSHVVYSAKDSDVKTVIINGKIVVQDRTVLDLDFNSLRDSALEYCAKIKKHLA